MSVQSDILTIFGDENAPLIHSEKKKECMYFHRILIIINLLFCLAHISWIMAAGLIVNAAMGVSLYLIKYLTLLVQIDRER